MTDSSTLRSGELRYTAYLVRMWQRSPEVPWIASAQSAESGEVVRFASLDALFSFLALATADRIDPPIDS